MPLACPPLPTSRPAGRSSAGRPPAGRSSAEDAWLDALVRATMADLDDDLARLEGAGPRAAAEATAGSRGAEDPTGGTRRRGWRATRWKATPGPRRRR